MRKLKVERSEDTGKNYETETRAQYRLLHHYPSFRWMLDNKVEEEPDLVLGVKKGFLWKTISYQDLLLSLNKNMLLTILRVLLFTLGLQ